MDVLTAVREHGYLIIFVALALESSLVAGLIVPGIGVLVLGGFLAGVDELSLPGVLTAAFAGTMVGDNLGYLASRYALNRLRVVQQVASRFRTTRERLEHGYPLHYLAFQFPMPLRVAFPILVGALQKRFLPWFVFDATASVLFVSTVGGVGFTIGALGKSAGFADNISNNLNLFFILIFVVWVAGVLISLARRKASGPR